MDQPAIQLINTFRCHRDWNSMPATANGRQCSSCKKEVHDFTGMEPAQILQVLQQNAGSVCGRIEAHKVKFRPELHPRNKRVVYRISHWYRTAAAAVSAFLMLVAGKAHGQEVTKPSIGQLPETQALPEAGNKPKSVEAVAEDTLSRKVKEYVLKGKVTDAETGETIPFANVVVKQKGKQVGGAASDFDGVYEIRINPANLKSEAVEVEVSFVSYTRKIITGVVLLAGTPRVINVTLASDPNYHGCDVIMVGYIQPILQEPGTRIITKEEIRRSPYR